MEVHNKILKKTIESRILRMTQIKNLKILISDLLTLILNPRNLCHP